MSSISVSDITVEYDENYGVDNRSGWSIAIQDHYYVQFHQDLKEALMVAIMKHLEAELDAERSK